MKEIIQKINKKKLSDETGLSYARLRKFSSGQLKKLSKEEIKKIHSYFLFLAEKFDIEE